MTKATLPVKAQLMDDEELTAWLEGRTHRRILAIPFGGPIPSAKSRIGVDLDGEWFSERTDIYGTYKALRENRERYVDFHHSFAPPGPTYGDPSGVMSGVILGKSILDKEPDEDGWWADIWLKAGEKRVALVKALARRGAQLFGSSQPIGTPKKDRETGEYLLWPHFLQTISTSPQNTNSVIVPAKAHMDDDLGVSPAIKALLADIDQLRTDLQPTSVVGEVSARDERYDAALAAFDDVLANLRQS